MFVLVLSPKSQDRLVTVPVELSTKFTVKGAVPPVGLPVKLATRGINPLPLTVFVKLPALAVLKRTLLLKAPSALGANWMSTLEELCPGRLKALPATTLNGPLPIVTTVLLAVRSPRLVTAKVAWLVVPTR